MPPSIAPYTHLTEVGRGGFGTVYQATEGRFGRKVAVKVIRDAGVGRDVVARFERECLALGSLSGHPNIVAVYDQGVTDEGDLYLVMEFLGGGSFADRLAEHGVAQPFEVASWGSALAGALETAHRSGIIHRDVKPENVLFSDYGVPKLVDFGIARMRSAYETRAGFVSATLYHAAPEIVAGASVSPSADIYSLASALYTMLAGKAPFERAGDETLVPLIGRIATASPPDLRDVGVPAELAAVIDRALAKQPEERFESAAAFGLALRDCLRATGLPDVDVSPGDAAQVAEAAATTAVARPTPKDPGRTVDVPRDRVVGSGEEPAPAPPKRRRWLVPVAAVAVLALVGGGAAALNSRGDDEPSGAGGPSSKGPTTAAALPIGTISDGEGCEGFACTFKVTSPTPLPNGAQWVWSVDGVQQTTSGDTLEHTFKKAGRSSVTVVASDALTSGPVASFKVRLSSWMPKVAVTSTDSTSTQGTVSVTVTSPDHPQCLPGLARLQVENDGDYDNQGELLQVPRTGKLDVKVDRGATYRVAMARQEVKNGVCEQANSESVAIGALAVDTTGPDPNPTQPTSTPTVRPTPPPPSPTHRTSTKKER